MNDRIHRQNFTFCLFYLFLLIPYPVVYLVETTAAYIFVNKLFQIDVSQIFKIWLAAEAFLLALHLPEKKVVPALESIGNKYSLYIYLFHYLIGVLIIDLLTAASAPDWIRQWILPVVVIILSILLAAAIYAVKHCAKK